MSKKPTRPRTSNLIEVRQRRTPKRGPAILCKYNPVTRCIEFQRRGVRSSLSLNSLLGIDTGKKIVYTNNEGDC